jgi:hypothetical protein
MNGLGFARRALVVATICAFGSPQAEAIEFIGAPSPAAHLEDGLVLTAAARRGGGGHGGGHHGGGMHRRAGHPGHRPGAPGHRPGHPGYRPGNPAYRPGYRPGHVVWARPGSYRWAPGGAVAAGAAIGFISAAAATWAGPPPQPGLCWFYTEPSRHQGFWDQCP